MFLSGHVYQFLLKSVYIWPMQSKKNQLACVWDTVYIGKIDEMCETCVVSVRWKEDELEDKVYGEQRMFYGEMKFPEFMFKPSLMTHNISLHCSTPSNDVGYTLLQNTICVPCLPGTMLDPYTDKCTSCPKNTYQDHLGALSCTRCHRNYYTHHVGML